jgi:hypothetical protein
VSAAVFHMAKTIAISQIGGSIAGGSLPAAPGAPASIAVSGFIDPVTNAFTLSVNVTPPATLGTFVGCHLYLEIPDQSAGTKFTIGTSTIGDGSTTTGAWFYLDLGKFPFSESEPWTVTGPAPATLNAAQDIPCRLYANPYSSIEEPPLVQANQASPSPNQTFTMVSLASGSPTAGTAVTAVSGPIVATVLSPVNVGGKLRTPVLVDVSSVPNNIPGWAYALVVTYGTADPTVASNLFVASTVQSQAGPVQPLTDGISVPHSFSLDTPTSMMTAIVWCVSGLLGSNNSFTPNPIVPGITPSWPITYGTTTGTTDASSVMLATIEASMAVVNGLFGVAVAGITNPLLGSGAVATINVQALAITNPLLASLCVQAANLANSSVTATAIANLAVGTVAIQTGAITNALIANLAVSGAQIQLATITGANIGTATIAGANIGTATITQTNMASASIGTAQIINLAVTDAKINDLSASKITAGTIAAVTITSVTINSGEITVQSVFLGTTTTISLGGAVNGLTAQQTISGVTYEAIVNGSEILMTNNANNAQAAFLFDGSNRPYCEIIASGSSFTNVPYAYHCADTSHYSALGPASLTMTGLPSSNPGAGSKQFWYDPSDSDRVKYAP